MAGLRAAAHALPVALRLGLALACLSLVSAGVTLFLLSQAWARGAVLEQRRVALEREIIQARAAAAEITRHRRDSALLHQQLERVTLQLPHEREIPPLYRRLYEAAASTGLAVALFQPRDARSQDHYTEIPIALTAEGTYHQLAAFLARVVELPRLVTVNGLRLTALERPSVSMRAELTLSTYVYRPAAPPTPAGPGAGGSVASSPGAVRGAPPSVPTSVGVAPAPPASTVSSTLAMSSPRSLAPDQPLSVSVGYSARGRRDPFDPIPIAARVSPDLQGRRPLIASARLTGIVLGPDGPLALVETPDGLGYILRAGDGIEEARVIRIGQDSVVFALADTPGRNGGHVILGLKTAAQ